MKSLLIGRSKECDIVISKPTVGRKHAELISDSETEFVLIDHESTNGTFLWNEGKWRRVTTTRVGLEDKVKFGDYETTIEKLRAEPRSRFIPDKKSKDSFDAKSSKKDQRRSKIERNPETGEIINRRKS